MPDNYLDPWGAPSFADPQGNPGNQLRALGAFASAIPPISWANNALDAFGKGLINTGRGIQDPGNALQVASFGSGAPGGLVRPVANDLSVIAGPYARMAPKDRLLEAQGAEMAGHSADKISDLTGWYRGDDSKWKWEIPDRGVKFAVHDIGRGQTKTGAELLSSAPSGISYPLSKILDHPKLYENYPELANLPVTSEPRLGTGASYGNDEIKIGTQALDNPSILLHEVQHAIQRKEGFAKGGSVDMDPRTKFDEQMKPIQTEYYKVSGQYSKDYMDALKAYGAEQRGNFDRTRPAPNLLDVIRQKYGDAAADRFNNLRQAVDLHTQAKDEARQEAFKNYKGSSGEVESRMVQRRFENPYLYMGESPLHTSNQLVPWNQRNLNMQSMMYGPDYMSGTRYPKPSDLEELRKVQRNPYQEGESWNPFE